MRTTRFTGIAVLAAGLAACGTDRPLAPEASAPVSFAVGDTDAECRTELATGAVTTSGGTTFPGAQFTYNACLDATDAGSNPGIELWTDAGRTQRLARSNDNNGQWDYAPAGAYIAGGSAVVYGTRTGSHGPVPVLWRYTGSGFLALSGVTDYFKPADEGTFCAGPYTIAGIANLFVTYNRELDDTDEGSNPGIVVRNGSCTGTQRWRSNDNNGQWDYRIAAVFVIDGSLRIVGGRSANDRRSFTGRTWTQPASGSFLVQAAGL